LVATGNRAKVKEELEEIKGGNACEGEKEKERTEEVRKGGGIKGWRPQ